MKICWRVFIGSPPPLVVEYEGPDALVYLQRKSRHLDTGHDNHSDLNGKMFIIKISLLYCRNTPLNIVLKLAFVAGKNTFQIVTDVYS